MPLIRSNTITEQTGRELIDAIDHLSACIADLVDVTSRNTAVSERVGGWTPPERIPNTVLSTPRSNAATPTAQALLDLTSARRHAEDRTDAEPENADDTPLIEREACS